MTSANVQVTKKSPRSGQAASRIVAVAVKEILRRQSERERESLCREDKNQNMPQSRLYKSAFLANNCGWLPEA